MAAFVLCFLVILSITAYSSATYCVCKDGLGEAVYQKDIDYACGNGADCAAIQTNGACFNPNTVRDHCNYAVNSYFQKKGQTAMSCDFSNSATTAPSLPSQQTSTCVYPSSASPAGTTPTTTPTTPGTGTTTPSTGTTTPSTGTTTPTTGTTLPPPAAPGGTAGTTTPSTGGTTFGTPPSSIFGMGPTSITPSTDKAHSEKPLFWAFALFSGPLLLLSF